MCALISFFNEGLAQWKFSAIAGSQLANFGGKDKKDWGGTLSDPELVFRYHGGIMADRFFSEKVYLSVGLLFSSKGAKYSGGAYDVTSQFYTYSYTKKLSYLDIPIIVNYNFSEKWSLGLGPQISFLLGAKVKNDKNAQKNYGLPETEDAKDSYSKLDIGLNVGPTYKINEKMRLMLLYQYGLIKIGKDQVYNNGGFDDTKAAIFNRVLLLSLIYTFKEQ